MRSHDVVAAVAAASTFFFLAPPARGQACCAGTGAVTPGRLALHERVILGVQAKAAMVVGSFDGAGRYAASPAGANEIDLEQDLFAAVRVLRRAQIALLVPLVETWRASLGRSELGGGIGDVNASARYDFTIAGTSAFLPGLAALAGVTFPTGRPADARDTGPLATGATGVGAYQLNAGFAVEQTFGPWLVNATGVVAERTARTVGSGPTAVREHLAPQGAVLAAVAYTFDNDWAVAASASYAFEGNATLDGAESASSSHRLLTVSLSGVAPLSGVWRVQGAVFGNPPIAQLGANQPADAGLSLALVHSGI
ncbi:MAG: hypothetical protein M3O36_17025 [Myxococcota bacterium]|nr:hypothetical protein [Myxococcota bacterium]